MLEYRFAPIERWPKPFTKSRRRAPFRASYPKTLRDLERELGLLGATACYIEAACTHDDIRNDGRIRSTAKLQHPGIVVKFQNRKGEWLSFACDTYSDWTDNLRGICLTLERLRSIERYGAVQGGQQYAGFKQLPGSVSPSVAEFPSIDEAARFLWSAAYGTDAPVDAVDQMLGRSGHVAHLEVVFRQAAKRSHPDAGGSEQSMRRVNAARDMLSGCPLA